jgi:predicted nucleic acid-binding protein
MIAVADASPLCYLVLIGEIDLLPKLFLQVAVPQAVIGELLHQDAPEVVRNWASNLPEWISPTATAEVVSGGLEKLQAGERAAIILAESIKADLILLDEKAARRVAAERGLRVSGILGVLGQAAIQGFVDLPSAIDRLRKTTFRCSPPLLKATLDQFGPRPAQHERSRRHPLRAAPLDDR